uniref:Cytochrome P450 CYP6DA1 n=1 Tax=Rhopalosiphum padi TaxID=40932 RepID=A0A7T3UYV3_RHOPD|nr:cytochrome P450 CYP6DA1 [Rhopalosiphum padi]UOW66127.1 cytochrome P450 6A13 [Rhopalosiphum padi]
MSDVWPIPFVQLYAVAILLVAFLFYVYLTYHYRRWSRLGVPQAEPTPPFGSLSDVVMGRIPLVDIIQSLYHKFDGHRYFGIYEGREPLLVIRDSELVHTIMVKDFRSFVDRNASKESFKHDKLFDHLVHLRGEQWKAIRAKLSPTFSAAKLKFMLGDINVCTTRLIDNLNNQMMSNNGIVDVSEASAQFTTDTIGRCAFGLDCNTLSNPDSEFRRTGQAIFAPRLRSTLLNLIRLFGFGRLLDVFRIRGMPSNIYDFFDNLLETTMEQHKHGKNSRNDFIALLVKLKEEEKLKENEKKLFTDDILAANTFVFFVAGFETTASTISYCLYELAMNPEIQVKLREKIKQTLDANDGKLGYDTLKDLKYLDMVINETFRLHPPVPVLNRVCTQKYTFSDSNITLNVGEKIIIPIYSIHHDPKYYSDPEIFDPERFSEENMSSIPHGTFLPFGDGPRICIGLRFAMMEAKTGLAEILSKFEISPCKETQSPIKTKPRSILLTPNESIRLSFKSIDQ